MLLEKMQAKAYRQQFLTIGSKNTTLKESMVLKKLITMNIYLFWILFLALWAIVPLMVIKGRTDEAPKIQSSPKVQAKKKSWFG